jgi:cyclophilin family peptidyl-prolyl cis-trans isomerase
MKKRLLPLLFIFGALVACDKPETKAPSVSTAESLPLEYPNDPVVLIKTNMGTIRAELYQEKAPKTVANFLQYVDKKHFDNTIFHRVIADFMIQGGGFENLNGNFVEKDTAPPVANESHNGFKNKRGTLAMARTSDPHSATAQWFINVKDNKNLDLGTIPDGYAVFGKVLSGMDVVDAIRAVPTASGRLTSRLRNGQLQADSHDDVPVKAVIIESVTKETAP